VFTANALAVRAVIIIVTLLFRSRKHTAGDGGVDVVVRKDGIESYIQCKHYLKNAPSPHDVRDFYGAIVDKLKNGGRGYFVTTKEFTPEAQEFAKDKPIELMDMQKIIEYIRRGKEPIAKYLRSTI
jgi:restriction system protein